MNRHAGSVDDERLQLALDAGQMGTWSVDLKTGLQSWDSRQFSLFGLPRGDAPTRQEFIELVVPEDRPAIELGPDRLRAGVRHTSQFRIRRADGQVRWLMGHSLIRADTNGASVELVGVNWDVTEQKLAEANAKATAERLQLALDAARMGTWSYDLATGKQIWDSRQYELLGLSNSVEPSRSAFMSVVLPEDTEKVVFTEDDVRPGRFHDTEFRVRDPDGAVRWLTARSFARHDDSGRPVERIGVNWM